MLTEDTFKNGKVLLIDKPLHWTSFQVVNKIRWETQKEFQYQKNQGWARWNLRSFSYRTFSDLHWQND